MSIGFLKVFWIFFKEAFEGKLGGIGKAEGRTCPAPTAQQMGESW